MAGGQARWPAPGRPARAASLAGSAAAGSRPRRMSNASSAAGAGAGAAQLAPGHGGRGTVAQVGLPPAWGSLLAVWGLPVRLATHDSACDLHSIPPAPPSAPVCGSLVIKVQCPRHPLADRLIEYARTPTIAGCGWGEPLPVQGR
jgi:hypothetical protein